MVKALFDTCILIDYLRGIGDARAEINRYDQKAISIVTWMEVMVGAAADVERGTRAFLEQFELVGVDGVTAERAVEVRKARRIKLPDAVIQASAEIGGMLLITRNAKDFSSSNLAFVRIPYEL
jgi:predicted nucleic acid-binding protein